MKDISGKKFPKTMYRYTQPNCRTSDKIHVVNWDYQNPVFDDDVVRLFGECEVCHVKFETTYSNPLLTIFGKRNSQAYNFDREVKDFNMNYTTARIGLH